MTQMVSGRLPGVYVEYDRKDQRVAKWFADPYVARRFYKQKFVKGKRPTVKGSVK